MYKDFIFANELESLIDRNNILILDIREREEYLEAHIRNAVNIKKEDIVDYIQYRAVGCDMVIIYCDYGETSYKVVEEIKKSDLMINTGMEIYSLYGGIFLYNGQLTDKIY